MRFSLDVPVEKRSLKAARDAIRLDLEFPPPMESTEAQADWQSRSAHVLASLLVRPQAASRSIGQVMQRGPPRPRPSSLPATATTSIPLRRR